ncbi:hypothetical protein [uncultured Sphingomonas sp.]|uniref:hypothetical protein n=1 Tax=uncultured Sphingomonas sp. TaxID=158754 RepID=UPI0035CB9355
MPIGTTPYVIGFESHLPRAFCLESTSYYAALRRSLASRRCRGIVAISHYAEKVFRAAHAGSAEYDAIASKLQTRYPNVDLGEFTDHCDDLADAPTIRVTFVGAHFARKGGCVAVRLAELAAAAGVPLEITIVSKLEMGGGIWTDPLRDGFFDTWRDRLKHPSIRWIE